MGQHQNDQSDEPKPGFLKRGWNLLVTAGLHLASAIALAVGFIAAIMVTVIVLHAGGESFPGPRRYLHLASIAVLCLLCLLILLVTVRHWRNSNGRED